MQYLSLPVRPMVAPEKNALLRMLRWLNVAPFGEPVVPLVNWMFTASVFLSSLLSSLSRARERSVAIFGTASKRINPGASVPMQIRAFSDGSLADAKWPGQDVAI